MLHETLHWRALGRCVIHVQLMSSLSDGFPTFHPPLRLPSFHTQLCVLTHVRAYQPSTEVLGGYSS